MSRSSGGEAVLGTVVLSLIIFVSASQCSSCSYPKQNQKQNTVSYSTERTYSDGYSTGYEEAKNEFQNSGYDSGYNKAKEEYQTKINSLTKEYEVKINDNYTKGFSDGEISMRRKIQDQIDFDAQAKVREGDWNAVLFTPKK